MFVKSVVVLLSRNLLLPAVLTIESSLSFILRFATFECSGSVESLNLY